MSRNLTRALSFALLAGCVTPGQAADARSRDWVKYPAVIEREAPATVYGIGDIHGDYQRLVRLLAAARIVPGPPAQPGAVAWSAGRSILVVTGDMIDKGPHPVDVLRLLIALRTAAGAAGGEVILLAGNHEAEFLAGPDEKKAADFILDLKRNGYAAAKVAACEGDLGGFLCSLPFAARVDDWFFSHAGNSGGRTLAGMDAAIRRDVDKNGFAAAQLVDSNSLLEARLGDGNSWFAVAKTADGERQLVASYAAALGVHHMVQGHQHNEVKFADGVERHAGEMFERWGLLFLIDVGMSEGVGDSHGAALRIESSKAVAVCPDGAETILWDAGAKADTGRAAPCSR